MVSSSDARACIISSALRPLGAKVSILLSCMIYLSMGAIDSLMSPLNSLSLSPGTVTFTSVSILTSSVGTSSFSSSLGALGEPFWENFYELVDFYASLSFVTFKPGALALVLLG